MTVEHHLDSTTLMRFASGDLDEAFAIVAATHIAMCEQCRHAVDDLEEVGGMELETVQSADLDAGAFEQMMLKLSHQSDNEPEPRQAPAGRAHDGDVPLPLVRHIGPRLDDVHWRTIAPGVRKHTLSQSSASGSKLYMLHIAPGTAVPEHGHGGAELTLILSGCYADSFGRFGRGDIADLDEHVEHQPQVEGDLPCICLVATEAPTRFKGLISRLMQPITGI